jgi:hypothetical protein
VDVRGTLVPARLLVITAIVAGGWSVSGRAAARLAPDADSLIGRVGERLAAYYSRAQSIVCLETSTVQPIQTNWAPEGMARTVESELRVESDVVSREIRRINGRSPRERDKKDRAGCTDPNPLSPEPLAFLMPESREDYRFTTVHETVERGRAALAIDFISANRRSHADLIEDERGHDDCFDWSGPIAAKGRVWVDANTNDVLRVERHLVGPVDLRVSWLLQRRHNLPQWFTLERDDVTMRYTEVTFSDPEEVVLLPESIESVTIVRSGLQSTRRTASFSGYRRFLTAGRVR